MKFYASALLKGKNGRQNRDQYISVDAADIDCARAEIKRRYHVITLHWIRPSDPPRPQVQPGEGSWKCRCGFVNKGIHRYCVRCVGKRRD